MFYNKKYIDHLSEIPVLKKINFDKNFLTKFRIFSIICFIKFGVYL